MPDKYTVRELRRRWKPVKERLAATHELPEIRVRLHRCCSWLQRVEDIETDGPADSDDALVFLWIAFNSLYGRWDASRNEPVSDHNALTIFVDQVLIVDRDKRIRSTLEDDKRLVMALFDNSYLNRYFWKYPSKQRAKKTEKVRFDAPAWYVQGDYKLILSRVLECIHFLRCQLVHGASTHSSKLNRTAVKHCSIMLAHLLDAFLLILIDHGHSEDWGKLCYPPLTD